MQEVNKYNQPVGRALIAKASLYEEDDQLEFHKSCGRTQLVTRKLANKFNDFLKINKLSNVKRVKFLNVSFYQYENEQTNTYKYYLCEKQLDVDRFMKWNDNKGGIHNTPEKRIWDSQKNADIELKEKK